jgi:hypothetical protein
MVVVSPPRYGADAFAAATLCVHSCSTRSLGDDGIRALSTRARLSRALEIVCLKVSPSRSVWLRGRPRSPVGMRPARSPPCHALSLCGGRGGGVVCVRFPWRFHFLEIFTRPSNYAEITVSPPRGPFPKPQIFRSAPLLAITGPIRSSSLLDVRLAHTSGAKADIS